MVVNMLEEKFERLEDLYKRLLPAIRSKKREMAREKMEVDEKDIWLYFCENVWKKKTALSLGEMVNDLLNEDNFTIYRYKKESRKE